MIYVGIDPGVHACGVACVEGDSMKLLGAVWARTTTADALANEVAEAVQEGIRLTSRTNLHYIKPQHYTVGIEFPEVTRDRARGDAKTEDLLELCWAIGCIEQALKRHERLHVARVQVSTWKRNVNTDVLEQRLHMAPPVGLDPVEHSTIIWPAPSYRHNVVDAIALARWLAEWPRKNPSKNIKDFGRL